MPYQLEIFCRRQQYEPSTSWYGPIQTLLTQAQTIAETIADAIANVAVTSATFNRWELLNAEGKKVNEGVITGITGKASGGIVDPKLFILARKNVEGEVENPSVVYLPFPSVSLVEDGALTVAGAAAFATMAIALQDAVVWNSDGLPVASYTFRHLTRRKKVRRVL